MHMTTARYIPGVRTRRWCATTHRLIVQGRRFRIAWFLLPHMQGMQGSQHRHWHSNMRFYKGGARKRDVLFTNAYGFHFYADVFRCLRLCLVGSHMFTAQKCTQGALFNIGDDGIHPRNFRDKGARMGEMAVRRSSKKRALDQCVETIRFTILCMDLDAPHRSPQKCQLSQDPSLPPHPVEGFSPAGLRLSGSTFYDSGLEITRTCPFRLSHSSYV